MGSKPIQVTTPKGAMNGAQALFKALTDAGLDTCFANPGTSEMQLVYEIGTTKGVRAVLCLQENVVTGAADGYGRMAGKPVFTLLHVGSGFANGIANTHNAGRANTPVANVVGCNATYHQPNYPEHELINGKVVDLAQIVSHWAHEAKSASDLAVLGAQAARFSRTGAGKVCTVVAPTNCHWDPATPPPAPAEPIKALKVSPETIKDTVALLTNGKKTAFVLGSHALRTKRLHIAAGERDHCLGSHHNGRNSLCPNRRCPCTRLPAGMSWRRHRRQTPVGVGCLSRVSGP